MVVGGAADATASQPVSPAPWGHQGQHAHPALPQGEACMSSPSMERKGSRQGLGRPLPDGKERLDSGEKGASVGWGIDGKLACPFTLPYTNGCPRVDEA
jgi:hypothetical protein